MIWPASWLSIIIVVRLSRHGTRYVAQKDLVADLAPLATPVSCHKVLSRLWEAKMVERAKTGRRAHSIRLTLKGTKLLDDFMREVR